MVAYIESAPQVADCQHPSQCQAMGRRPREGYHHGDLRRALLDATLRLAAEKSPAGVSLRESAREAGVSPAAPYRHFQDKQNMLAAAAEEGFRILLERIGRSAAQATLPA